MTDQEDREYVIRVYAFGLSDKAIEKLFDRVADVAHESDEEVFCIGGYSGEGGGEVK